MEFLCLYGDNLGTDASDGRSVGLANWERFRLLGDNSTGGSLPRDSSGDDSIIGECLVVHFSVSFRASAMSVLIAFLCIASDDGASFSSRVIDLDELISSFFGNALSTFGDDVAHSILLPIGWAIIELMLAL